MSHKNTPAPETLSFKLETMGFPGGRGFAQTARERERERERERGGDTNRHETIKLRCRTHSSQTERVLGDGAGAGPTGGPRGFRILRLPWLGRRRHRCSSEYVCVSLSLCLPLREHQSVFRFVCNVERERERERERETEGAVKAH
jgi:hypothetical protein